MTRSAPRAHPAVALTDNWEAFLGSAAAKHQARGLARLAAYCAYRKIDPDAVSDKTLLAFQAYLDDRLLAKDPKELVKEMVWSFNAIVRKNQCNWPLLIAPASDRYRAAPLTIYAATLRKDIDDYKKRLSHDDLFSDDGPQRALKPTSIRNMAAHVRQFLDAANTAGFAPSRFNTLADVVKSDVITELSRA